MTRLVLIVGGGLAGMTVARLLRRAGLSFLVLEARDRLSMTSEGVSCRSACSS